MCCSGNPLHHSGGGAAGHRGFKNRDIKKVQECIKLNEEYILAIWREELLERDIDWQRMI